MLDPKKFQHKLVYLAAPYSDKDPAVVEKRIKEFLEIDAILTQQGIVTVSPLYKHFLLHVGNIPGDWEYWKKYSLTLLEKCDAVFVLGIDGWDESTGVKAETEAAKECNIPVHSVDHNGTIFVPW